MKRFLLIAFAAVMMAGCAERQDVNTDKKVINGHDFQYISLFDKPCIAHSPECDSCASIRKTEIREILMEVLQKSKEEN